MSSYALKSRSNGMHLVVGLGFTAATVTGASLFDDKEDALDAQDCAKAIGFESDLVVVGGKSFAVCYVRPEDLNADNSIKTNTKNPSKWRFATREEAITHGSRFAERKVRGTDTPKGHIGFYVVETNDAVNGAINPATGKTNKV